MVAYRVRGKRVQKDCPHTRDPNNPAKSQIPGARCTVPSKSASESQEV